MSKPGKQASPVKTHDTNLGNHVCIILKHFSISGRVFSTPAVHKVIFKN